MLSLSSALNSVLSWEARDPLRASFASLNLSFNTVSNFLLCIWIVKNKLNWMWYLKQNKNTRPRSRCGLELKSWSRVNLRFDRLSVILRIRKKKSKLNEEKNRRKQKKVHKEKNENPETPSQCERQHFLADTKRRAKAFPTRNFPNGLNLMSLKWGTMAMLSRAGGGTDVGGESEKYEEKFLETNEGWWRFS